MLQLRHFVAPQGASQHGHVARAIATSSSRLIETPPYTIDGNPCLLARSVERGFASCMIGGVDNLYDFGNLVADHHFNPLL